MVVKPGETPRESAADICYLVVESGRTTLQVMLQRPPPDACGKVQQVRTQNSGNRRAVFTDLQGYGQAGLEMRHEKYVSPGTGGGPDIPFRATHLLAFCQGAYFFHATGFYNGDVGEVVPTDVVEDIRNRARGTLERLGAAPPPPDTGAPAQDAEAALVESLGPGPLDALREVSPLLQANSPVDLLRDPGAADARRRLLDRLGKNPEGMTAQEKQTYATFAWMAALANATDVNGRRAFPASNASLSILLGLATTALSDPDPSRAHQAATAMDRYAAMLRRMDVQALQDRHAP
jgi:hypothetical protein